MAEIDTLLAHLSPSFTSQTENIAVEALGYILNKYAGSREGLDDVVRSGVRSVNSVVQVRTQASAPDGTRPDLVGIDESGAERVLIEAKFWADLTPRQPHAYLDRLPRDGPAVLLFLVPEERIVSLWPVLRTRAEESGMVLSDVDGERKCVSVDGTQRHLLLVSWTGLLDRMSARTRDERDAEADIRQLRGLADFAEEERTIIDRGVPISADSALSRHLIRIIDSATERGIANGWASRKGLNRTPRSYGYGRYLKLGGRVVWFGIHTGRWERDGETPLWLDCGHNRWVPIEIDVARNVEYADVLDGVASSLRDFAEDPYNNR